MNEAEIAVHMALTFWNRQNARMEKILNSFDNNLLSKDVAPGRNSGKYLLGHILAMNDSMLALFGLGERLFPHYDEIFINNSDKSGLDMPDIQRLREDWYWGKATLSGGFNQISYKDWFSKHTAMSDEDFAKEPTRNKLNVLINRTNHMAYHLGQIALIK